MGYDEGGSGFAFFLTGLGIGALIGVLYAPKSGSETRQEIRNAAEEGRDYVINRARQARDTTSQWVEKGKDILSQQKENIASAVQAGKQAYRDATVEPQGPGYGSVK